MAYDGSGYHGFARQRGQRTVQGSLEDALAVLLKSEVTTTGAGRTDAGVHATGQVVSFVWDGDVPPAPAQRLTGICGPDLAVVSWEEAPPDFDARFSARWRRYRYRILNRDAPDPLRRRVTWHVRSPLDVAALDANGKEAVGEHDFTAFCRVPPSGHARRRVLALDATQVEDEVQVAMVATAFCHQMVRSLVGTMVEGRSVADALAARDRGRAGRVAPPYGLCLEDVGYRDWDSL